jgi:hypothetical protein
MQKERMIILLDLGFVFSKEEISRIAEMSRDIKISED